MLPAEALWRSAIGKMVLTGGAVAERHQEAAAGRGAVAELLAGQGAAAERHREDVAGRGAVAAEMLLSRTLLAEKTQGCIGKLLLAGDA